MHAKSSALHVGATLILVLACSTSLFAQTKTKKPEAKKTVVRAQITWQDWSNDVFVKSKRLNKYVLLDLNAKWCHWCHFMEQRTYVHEDVVGVINRGFLAVRADQDANPDLSSRYGDWGWPATIIFDAQGNEVAKLQGFMRPSLMTHILTTILDHPERIPKLIADQEIARSPSTFISPAQRKTILGLLENTYDAEFGGWGRRLKFLQPDVIEYALEKARTGDETLKTRVIASLDAASVLLDKEWGGFYQYSHERDWSAPHFEKIMWYQAQPLSLYSRASVLFDKPEYLATARQIYGYMIDKLLSPQGAFYTSQDADVDEKMLGESFYALSAAKRNGLGKSPPIDKNIYARENGWAISGLLGYFAATGDDTVLKTAIAAARWIITNRALPEGGFRHGDKDRGGPFLSDTLSMGSAMLGLYMATGDKKWLTGAAKAGDFIAANFKHSVAGYKTANAPAAKGGVFGKSFVNIEENSRLARFTVLLHQTLGKSRFKDMAEHAMRYLTNDSVTSKKRFLAGLVLADEELAIEPAHITIVGSKSDARSKALHRAALKLPIPYKRVDWWDPGEGAMPNPDITYPEMDRPAAFACANQVCSLPIFESADLTKSVERMGRKRRVAPRAKF